MQRDGRLDETVAPDENRPAVSIVERPDTDGARWKLALELLLEAGCADEENATA